jgi:phytoene dehydrogenase-like protein
VPGATFAIGIDRPLYLSVHSAVARLAPEGAATLHAAMYLRDGVAIDATQVERELEDWVDAVQPGWRNCVVERRFLPRLTVAHAVWTPNGRPGPEVAGVEGLYLAGDWIGTEGMLSDASLASAAQVATSILRRGTGREAA